MVKAATTSERIEWLPLVAALSQGRWKDASDLSREKIQEVSNSSTIRSSLHLLVAYAELRSSNLEAASSALEECSTVQEFTQLSLSELVDFSDDYPLHGFEPILWSFLSSELCADRMRALSFSSQAVERLRDYLLGIAPFLGRPLSAPFENLPAKILLSHASRSVTEGHPFLAEKSLVLLEGLIPDLTDQQKKAISTLRHQITSTMERSWKSRIEKAVDNQFFPHVEVRCLNRVTSPVPRLTVCIPSYRAGDWLKITVDAVLTHAEYDNIEVLIALQKEEDKDVADGAFLNDPLYRNDNRIRVFHYDGPIGSNAARYELATQASGEILCFLSAKTIPSPGFARLAVDYFVKNRAVSLLAPAVTPLGEDNLLGRPLLTDISCDLSGLLSHGHRSELPERRATRSLYVRPSFHSSAIFLTTDVFERTGKLLHLLPTHPRALQAVGRAAYFHGYETYLPLNVSCISKVRKEPEAFQSVLGSLFPSQNPHLFKESVFLVYLFFSADYFQHEFLGHLKLLSSSAVREALQVVEEHKEFLLRSKRSIWRGVRRSQKHFWGEFGDEIIGNLSPGEYARLVL